MKMSTKQRAISPNGRILRDIRYFECPGLPEEGRIDPVGTLVHVTPAMQAWAKRLVALCRQQSLSIGKPHHVYLCFTFAMPDGEVRPTDFRLEAWQQYVACGLPPDFNALSEEFRAQQVRSATIDCLKTLMPKHGMAIDELAAIVDDGGEGLVLPLLEKQTRQYRIVVGRTIPPWPASSDIWISVEERATGCIGRCKLIETRDEEHAMALAGKISLADGAAIVQPKSSFDGNYYARQYNVSRFAIPIDELLAGHAPRRPSRAYRSRS